jgi:hypothetical protein
MSLEIVPMSLEEANAFVSAFIGTIGPFPERSFVSAQLLKGKLRAW